MSKIIVINDVSTEVPNNISVQEIEGDLSTALNSAVDGWIEIVRPITGLLEQGEVMVVNEEGHCRGLELNLMGTLIYGYGPIVGNIVICKEAMTNEGLDLFPFDDTEVSAVVERLERINDIVFNSILVLVTD